MRANRQVLPIADFSIRNLSGWRKNRIVVSNSPNPLSMDFSFESRILANWPSQHTGRYRKGYIKFRNGKLFDLQNQTIGGIKSYLFRYEDVGIYWELYIQRTKFIDLLNTLPDTDFFAAVELGLQRLEPTRKVARNKAWAEQEVERMLPALGLPDLRELTSVMSPTAERVLAAA